MSADFDHDGLSNWDEVSSHQTDPLNPDTDGDGFMDGDEVTAGTNPLDPAAFPLEVVASMPNFQPGSDAYFGHSCSQPVILYLNQPLAATTSFTSSWLNDLNGEFPVPAAGTTTILPGRQAIAFAPTGNSFVPWAEDQEAPPVYEIDFTTASTGLTHLMPFHKFFTTTTADGSLDCGPWIDTTAPGSDFIDTACDTTLTAKWSEALDPTTVIPANAALVPDGGNPVAISVDFDYGKDVNLLRITPVQALAPATRYTVTLGTGFQNLTDKAHAQPVSWSFTTRPERPTPVVGAGPYVVAVSPPDFSFGIAPPDSVSITFSEDMDPATLSADSIHLRAGNGADLPGTFTYNAATHTLIFQPAAPFPFSAYHALTLDLARVFNNATEESGGRKALQAAGTFVFSTANRLGNIDTGGNNGTQAPASIAPMCIHYAWATVLGLGAISPNAGVASAPGCSVSITLIDKAGGTKVETLPPCTDALQVLESEPVAPATTVVITPHFVPGSDKHPDLTTSEVFILPSDGPPPPGMTYLVLRTTPPAVGNGAPTVEYLGRFGVALHLTAGWIRDGTGLRGPQSLYLVPVPIERNFGLTPLVGDIPWYRIEGTVGKALPGQKINLRLEDKYLTSYGPGSVSLGSFQWTIPDKTFKDYIVDYPGENNHASGTLTLLEGDDLSMQNVHYYWADSGEKEITVTYLVNLSSQSLTEYSSAKISVDKPSSTFSIKTGEERVDKVPDHNWDIVPMFGLLAMKPKVSPGAKFIASVNTPAGWGAGDLCWVQLIKSKRNYTYTGGVITKLGDGESFKLDTSYPYGRTYPANGSVPSGDDCSDTPRDPLTGMPTGSPPAIARNRIKVDETFETYLMFKPSGLAAECRYVPLQKVTWRWGGVASSENSWDPITERPPRDPNNSDPNVSEIPGTECTDHPEWTDNTTSDREVPDQ